MVTICFRIRLHIRIHILTRTHSLSLFSFSFTLHSRLASAAASNSGWACCGGAELHLGTASFSHFASLHVSLMFLFRVPFSVYARVFIVVPLQFSRSFIPSCLG
ncbi:unnamed protein product [Amoebophrya sp. A25]|nr:unnamed protein product [Amoebophrya sp. A25]|eukprot:GSA25T00004509001.1